VVPQGLILESALWCRYCAGVDERGAVIEPNDPNWEMLTARAKAAKDDAAVWTGMAAIYGDLGSNRAFTQAFAGQLAFLWAHGADAAMKRFIG
jgi:mannitol 2-dehydrogenase